MAYISQFNILLNILSSDLSKLNLHNLVHVCGELISEIEYRVIPYIKVFPRGP